tara:strand:+ start:685 stop:1011 length:327 start_codon:yes stop_codon:yes gene_type:complete
MTILKTAVTPQTFKIVPRELQATEIELIEEGSTEIETVNITTVIDRYFLEITATFALREGGKYSFRVLNGTEEVFLGSIFCTDQDKDNYSINDGVYKESKTENNLITY